MWFRNAQVYRVSNLNFTLDDLREKLSQASLKPCLSADMKTKGWMLHEIEEADYVVEVDGNILLSLGFEKKLLPASIINQQAGLKINAIEQQENIILSKRKRKEIKEEIQISLMAKAFTLRSKVYIWMSKHEGLLVIGSSSAKLADECIEALIKLKLNIEIRKIIGSQLAQTMNAWIFEDDLPNNFSLDRSSEFTDNKTGKIKIQYKNISPSKEDVEKIIKSDKSVTKLFMTWGNRISFNFDRDLKIKGIELIDTAKEDIDLLDHPDRLIADFYLLANEMNPFLKDFISAVKG